MSRLDAATGGPGAHPLADIALPVEGARAAWAAAVGAECARQGVEMPARWVERSGGGAICAVWWGPEGLGGRYANLEFDDAGEAVLLLSDRSKAPKPGEPERYDWLRAYMVLGGGPEEGPAIGLVEAVRRIGAWRQGRRDCVAPRRAEAVTEGGQPPPGLQAAATERGRSTTS